LLNISSIRLLVQAAYKGLTEVKLMLTVVVVMSVWYLVVEEQANGD